MNRASFSTKSAFKKVTHVIFDLDGLLLDTEGVYRQAIVDIAKKHGKIYTSEIKNKVMGTRDTDSAKIAVREMKLPMNPDDFLKQFKAITNRSFYQTVPFMPGAERLIRHFHHNQVPIAVATSSSKDSYELKTSKHKEFFSLFHHAVTGGSDPEVKQGKPSPDIFLVCATRFIDKPAPDKCLVFEDAPNGVEAGRTAGMQVVMVPDKQVDEELCKNATIKLDSLENVKPELFGLPPFS